jgi:hypothetical protein
MQMLCLEESFPKLLPLFSGLHRRACYELGAGTNIIGGLHIITLPNRIIVNKRISN